MDKLEIKVDYTERGTSQWEEKAKGKLIELATSLYENPRDFEFRYQNDNYNYKIKVTAIFDSDGPIRKKPYK